MSSLSEMASNIIVWTQANSTAILSAIGVSSATGAIISAAIATIENTRKIDNEKAERERLGLDEMTAWEIAKMVSVSYIPAAILFGMSMTSFIVCITKAERKAATFAGLYSISEKTFEEYRNKTKEMFGERKERKIKEEIAADRALTASRNNKTYIITGNGSYKCLDAYSNTKFMSSQIAIEKARIRILDRLRSEMYISLAEVYEEMGLPVRMDDDGHPLVDRTKIGWNQDDGLEFTYTYCADDNGEPMMVIWFDPDPHDNYNKMW